MATGTAPHPGVRRPAVPVAARSGTETRQGHLPVDSRNPQGWDTGAILGLRGVHQPYTVVVRVGGAVKGSPVVVF